MFDDVVHTGGGDGVPTEQGSSRLLPSWRARLLLLVLAGAALPQISDASRITATAGPHPPGRAPAETFASSERAQRIAGKSGRDRDGRLTGPAHQGGTRRRSGGLQPSASRTPPGAGRHVTPEGVRRYPDAASLYDVTTLRTVFLEFDTPNWEQELASYYRRDLEVPALVTIDGRTYRDVGVRFRGNSSYRQVADGYKRSLNLSFDYLHRDQEVGGYRTLNLLNANNDPTFVRTVLYSEIARRYAPAPRANFVRVVINGESWGVYVNVQQFNKDFARDFFGTTAGARWKVPGSPRGRAGLEYLGDSIELYRRVYEIKSKDDEKSWHDLMRLCRLLSTTPPEKLEAVLAPHLDIEGVLKFLAIEMALVNADGYWARASDYSIYQDPSGRFHIVPYDFNEPLGAEGVGGRRGGHGSGPRIDPLLGLDDPSKPLRSRLLVVPGLRDRYVAYLRDIAETSLDWARLQPLVRRYQALIRSEVEADGRKLYGAEAFSTASLQRFVEERRTFLLERTSREGVR